MSKIALVGGVKITQAVLHAMQCMGKNPELLVTYDESRGDAAGFWVPDTETLPPGTKWETVRDINDIHACHVLGDHWLIIVAGWSQIVDLKADYRRHDQTWIGFHPTLLPEGRGRAPIPWTILKGLTVTGATLFKLTPECDAGPIYGQIKFPVAPDETSTTLYAKHEAAYAGLIRSCLGGILDGSLLPFAQDHAKATYWPKRTPEDSEVHIGWAWESIDRHLRAMTDPYPPPFTFAGVDNPQKLYVRREP